MQGGGSPGHRPKGWERAGGVVSTGGCWSGEGLQEGLTGCRKPVPGLDRAVCDPSGC